MTKEEVEELIVQSKCRRRTWPLEPPGASAWQDAVSRIGCAISPDYRILFEVSLLYWVGFDLFGPLCDALAEGYVSFIDIYHDEMSNNPRWDAKMLPICAVGNGDYVALLLEASWAEKVYYIYHEDGHAELLNHRVEEWIRDLPGQWLR